MGILVTDGQEATHEHRWKVGRVLPELKGTGGMTAVLRTIAVAGDGTMPWKFLVVWNICEGHPVRRLFPPPERARPPLLPSPSELGPS